MAVHCWISRYEAMGMSMDEAIAEKMPSWDGDGESLWDYLDAVCLLEDGHEGEHEYTPTADISVTFAPASKA